MQCKGANYNERRSEVNAMSPETKAKYKALSGSSLFLLATKFPNRPPNRNINGNSASNSSGLFNIWACLLVGCLVLSSNHFSSSVIISPLFV